MISGKVTIKNPTGLHLRPAGLFCKTAMEFKSKITVYKKTRYEDVTANAKVYSVCLAHALKAAMRFRLSAKAMTKNRHLRP